MVLSLPGVIYFYFLWGVGSPLADFRDYSWFYAQGSFLCFHSGHTFAFDYMYTFTLIQNLYLDFLYDLKLFL